MATTAQSYGNKEQIKMLQGKDAPGGAVWLETLDLKLFRQGWGSTQVGKSVEGRALTLNGQVYSHGIGSHAWLEYTVDLNGCATRFVTLVGVDDECGTQGSIAFEVWVDSKKAFETGVMRGGEPAKLVEVDLKGAKRMMLKATDAGDGINYDHVDLAGALLFLDTDSNEKPTPMRVGTEPAIPIASGVSAKPAINGPRIVGTTPGRPFLFLVPATGEAPLTFEAKNLPDGLSLDNKTGIVSGSLKSAGEYVVDLKVSGPKGSASRKLKIVGGENKIALTPPMGWNSWYVWAGVVDEQKMRVAADWMVKSGLAAHGYQYVSIDDCWQGTRDANGEIQPNGKFKDMKALGDYIHSRGLKFGVYSSPGPKTCAGFEGSFKHEEQDAEIYAKWGADLLKYDWCSYAAPEWNLAEVQNPYRVMQEALRKCDRDIFYSLCQYGMMDVWTWGDKVGGNCWRTTGDIGDWWDSMSAIGFSQDGHEKFAGPGHWNDPDMLMVGMMGMSNNLHPSSLTKNEQIVQVTLWSLISAPLLISADLSQLDQFTKDILTNDEVIAVNQDPLGKPAGRKSQSDGREVWARPLWDGTIAVGLFNRGIVSDKVTAKWSDLGLKGEQPVRDLWQKKNIGKFKDSFSAEVPPHGAVFVKIGKPSRTDW